MYRAYHMKGQPEKSVASLRDMIARSPGPHLLARACLVLALTNSGVYEGAKAATEGLLSDAETTANPNAKTMALLAHGWAYRDTDPTAAYDVNLQALKIAQDTCATPVACDTVDAIGTPNSRRVAASNGNDMCSIALVLASGAATATGHTHGRCSWT
jgi:hypothetical protein